MTPTISLSSTPVIEGALDRRVEFVSEFAKPGSERNCELAARCEPERPSESSLGLVAYPVVRIVPATFSYVGKLQPMPVPDLDD